MLKPCYDDCVSITFCHEEFLLDRYLIIGDSAFGSSGPETICIMRTFDWESSTTDESDVEIKLCRTFDGAEYRLSRPPEITYMFEIRQ